MAWRAFAMARSGSRQAARILVALLALVLAAPSLAHAYIDFGLGSYAFQIVIAWGLAMAFALRTFWGRIVAFIRKLWPR